MDDAVEIEACDSVGEGPSYAPSAGRKGIPSPGRRGGKKTLSQPTGTRSGGHSRHTGRSFGSRIGFDPRLLASSISSMLLISVTGVIAIAAILYYTFSSGSYPSPFPQFYGALAAAMVFVLLLSYITVKLMGSGK